MENMETNTVTEQETAEKTFTQEELEAIIGERLFKERKKYADYEALKEKAERLDKLEEDSKSELQKATERAQALDAELKKIKAESALRDLRETIATDTGVPASLLTQSTEEDLRKQAEELLAFRGNSYPSVQDGGTVLNTTTKKDAKQQFADLFA